MFAQVDVGEATRLNTGHTLRISKIQAGVVANSSLYRYVAVMGNSQPRRFRRR